MRRKGEVRRKERNREEQRAGRAGEGGEEDGREGGKEVKQREELGGVKWSTMLSAFIQHQ